MIDHLHTSSNNPIHIPPSSAKHTVKIKMENQVSAKQLRAMLRAQDYEQALPVLDAMLRKNPNDAPAHWHRASCMEAFGRLDEALAEVEHVLRINPDYAPATLKRAELTKHQGKSLEQALAQFASDDPMDMQVTHIAYQIYCVGNEAEPSYVESRIEDYPKYQQSFARQALQTMSKTGFQLVGDYEPLHLREVLGQPTLVRIYSGDQNTCFAASYCVAPKWPGLLGFMILFLTGKWKKPAVIELITAISDGQFIITNNSGSANPFNYGGKIAIEKLALDTKIEDVVKRHRARVNEYLGINHKARAQTVASMEEITPLLTRLSQAKNRYRQSIGYVTDSELIQLLGGHYEQLAKQVRARIFELAH